MNPVFGGDFDLLIVGGGIVGAGVARDAALRGLRVALVDRYDFAFGTSSRSSRLLHGGIRYLAQGRVSLVREASREKHILRHIAPHLTQPLPFLFLTYRGSHYPLWKLRFGVKLYDWLCGAGNLGRSQCFNAAQTQAHLGAAQPLAEGLTGAARYFDALTQDSRLVLDTLRSAALSGATLANYTQFEGAERRGVTWHCRLRDVESKESGELRAKAIVCAAGPWAEGLGENKLRLRLTKGIHLVVDRARLPVPDAIVMTEGKRVLFAIPWGERVILGTTDTDFQAGARNGRDPLAAIQADAGDIAYVLKVTNAAFPQACLHESDVIATWAGLRPLIADPNGSPSDISRSHEIRVSAPGWIEVAGGKLTTYRRMAEETVDRVMSELKRDPGPRRSAQFPLLPPDRTEGLSSIVPPPFTREAVLHYCRNEWARHVSDVLLRRGGWHFYARNRAELAEQASHWMAEALKWTDEQRRADVRAYREAPDTYS